MAKTTLHENMWINLKSKQNECRILSENLQNDICKIDKYFYDFHEDISKMQIHGEIKELINRYEQLKPYFHNVSELLYYLSNYLEKVSIEIEEIEKELLLKSKKLIK